MEFSRCHDDGLELNLSSLNAGMGLYPIPSLNLLLSSTQN